MSRHEFDAKTKRAAWDRCEGHCENAACGILIGHKVKHFDHLKPDGLGGKPTLENCQVLCLPCHKDKTHGEDQPRMTKADNQRKADQGLKPPPRQQIKSRGFAKAAPKADRIGLPPRVVDAFGRRIG